MAEKSRYACLVGVALLVFLIKTAMAASSDFYPFSSDAEAQRFHALIQEIRCIVCQHQSIADSNAPLAKDLRRKIYQLINEKKSNEEIKDYLVTRYGEFILFRPRLNKTTLVLWCFPFAGLLFILIFIFIFLFRWIRLAKVPLGK